MPPVGLGFSAAGAANGDFGIVLLRTMRRLVRLRLRLRHVPRAALGGRGTERVGHAALVARRPWRRGRFLRQRDQVGRLNAWRRRRRRRIAKRSARRNDARTRRQRRLVMSHGPPRVGRRRRSLCASRRTSSQREPLGSRVCSLRRQRRPRSADSDSLQQLVERLARRLAVLQLELAVGDGQQRLGRARVIGRAGGESAQRHDRLLVLALAVLRIAEPEARRVGEAAGRIAAGERAEGIRRGCEVAAAQHRHRFVELAFFFRVGQEFAPVERHLHRLHLAHALVDALRNVFLAPLQLGDVARQLLVVAAQLGQLGAQRLDAVVQLEQAALELAHLLVEGGVLLLEALAVLLVAARDALAQIENRLACLVVVEQARLRRQRCCGGKHQRGD